MKQTVNKLKGYKNQWGLFIKPEDLDCRKSNPFYKNEVYTPVFEREVLDTPAEYIENLRKIIFK